MLNARTEINHMRLNRFRHTTHVASASALLAITALMTSGAIAAQSSNSNNRVSIASNLRRCQMSQLTVRAANGDAGAGHVGWVYAFTNTSSSTCTLYGYPGFLPLDAKGHPLAGVKVTWSNSNYLHHAQRHHIALAPSAQASFEVVYSDMSSLGENCPASSKVEITPPNAYQHFTLNEHLSPCREVFITPVEAGVINP